MSKSAVIVVGGIEGERLYQRRSRTALPILVRQAKAGQTILYNELSGELGMPNPRNLNYVLGAIGRSLLELGEKIGKKVPPIQALVINKQTGLPGEGISFFASDASMFKEASSNERRRIVRAILAEVFLYRQWDEVLHSFGLEPLPPLSEGLPPAEEIVRRGGTGEGARHRRLKETVATHPEWFGLPSSLAPGQMEVPLYFGDRVDVVFSSARQRTAIEVKTADAPPPDLIRGIFQCVKYAAVLEAEASVSEDARGSKAILALGGSLPSDLVSVCTILGIEIFEGLEAAGSSEEL